MTIFILIPRLDNSGPSKGAIAYANLLCNHYSVYLVSVKPNSLKHDKINEKVISLSLGSPNINFIRKIVLYRRLLKEKKCFVSLSLCLSSDIVNLFCKDISFTMISVRGNLPKIYFYDYGPFYIILGYLHLFLMNNSSNVLTMSDEMSYQVGKLIPNKKIFNIHSIISETLLDQYKFQKPNRKIKRIVFVGSLSSRKKPVLLLKTFKRLVQSGFNLELHILGNGPLLQKVNRFIFENSLKSKVKIHCFLDNPYEVIAHSDLFVLPSMAEGIPRAAIEALYLGLPCVLRNIDGNSDLITNGVNGFLFHNDTELYDTIITCIKHIDNRKFSNKLLPINFTNKQSLKIFNTLFQSLTYNKNV